MEKNKKALMLSVLAIITLVLITVCVTYAFFNYAREGTTENTITTGTITFIYEEVDSQGAGISIEDAFPISDSIGKAQSGSGKVFNFKVKSQTMNTAAIPYIVTARMKADSTLPQDAVKIYLTEVAGNSETELLLDTYDQLPQTSIYVPDGVVEKEIYTDTVPANSNIYEKNFRLRMWIDDSIGFSPVQENGQDVYPYNDKTFIVTINVYANAKVVTDEEIALESNANISLLLVDGEELTLVTDQDYDYETTLADGTTSTDIIVETENTNATVNIEKIDSLVYDNTANVQRLSTSKTVELTAGDNYFKVTVISQNKEVTKEYKVKINVIEYMNSSTLLSVGEAVTAKDGSKWHVLEASASGTVVLLSDYNLNSDGSYNTNCQGVSGNLESYYCSPMAFDVDNTNTYSETDSNNIGYFIKKTYAPKVIEVLPGTTNVTLPTAYQIATADGQTFNHSILTFEPSWLTTTNY